MPHEKFLTAAGVIDRVAPAMAVGRKGNKLEILVGLDQRIDRIGVFDIAFVDGSASFHQIFRVLNADENIGTDEVTIEFRSSGLYMYASFRSPP